MLTAGSSFNSAGVDMLTAGRCSNFAGAYMLTAGESFSLVEGYMLIAECLFEREADNIRIAVVNKATAILISGK